MTASFGRARPPSQDYNLDNYWQSFLSAETWSTPDRVLPRTYPHSPPHIPIDINLGLSQTFFFFHSPSLSTPNCNMSKLHTLRKNNSSSTSEMSPSKDGDPFENPRFSSTPGGRIRRLRNTLAKLAPSGSAEKEWLKKYNDCHCKIPLTERNVDNFVCEQQLRDVYHPKEHSTELQVSAWLDKVS